MPRRDRRSPLRRKSLKAIRVGSVVVVSLVALAVASCLAEGVRPSRVMATSLLSLTSSPNPSLPNSFFTLTATVSGSGPIPTGTVTFFVKPCPEPCAAPTVPIGTVGLDSSERAILMRTSPSNPGSYSFSAVYNGDSNYSTSIASLSQVVAVDAAAPVPTLEIGALILLGLLLTVTGVLVLRKGNG